MVSVSSASAAVESLITVALLAIATTLGLGSAACRQDMHDQPKYQPLERSPFFIDQQASRSPVAGTVARGDLRDDILLYTGKVDGQDALMFPFRVDEAVMARGRERFDIYCSPCHGQAGLGD